MFTSTLSKQCTLIRFSDNSICYSIFHTYLGDCAERLPTMESIGVPKLEDHYHSRVLLYFKN